MGFRHPRSAVMAVMALALVCGGYSGTASAFELSSGPRIGYHLDMEQPILGWDMQFRSDRFHLSFDPGVELHFANPDKLAMQSNFDGRLHLLWYERHLDPYLGIGLAVQNGHYRPDIGRTGVGLNLIAGLDARFFDFLLPGFQVRNTIRRGSELTVILGLRLALPL